LTNSEVQVFRRCALEHYFAFVLGVRPLGSDAEALRFGSLFHVGLAAWWLAYETPGEQLTAALEVMRPLAEDEYDMARAECLMRGYDARWAGAEDVEVLQVEWQFQTPLLNPATGAASRTYLLAGKLDALVRNRGDGAVYIVEHKTSSQDIGPGSQYWDLLRLDSQISTYFAGARGLGYVPVGCLYDVIGKTKHIPLKATPEAARKYTKQGLLYANQRDEDETAEEYGLRITEAICADPDRYYRRGFVVRLEDEVREAADDVWQTARLMREARAAGVYPRNVGACERYGRLCAYHPVCTRTASLEDATRYERVDNVHPELGAWPEADAAE
jgi:PD-(D/E)XK nuclease superfamily